MVLNYNSFLINFIHFKTHKKEIIGLKLKLPKIPENYKKKVISSN